MSARILVCDDDIHITLAVKLKLSHAGFDVMTASDGAEGWQLIQNQMPDLLITDCQMPFMDGLQLCRQLRSHPRGARVPVFLLTAKSLELDAEALRAELGIRELVMKPFSPRDLLKRVQQALGEAAMLVTSTESYRGV